MFASQVPDVFIINTRTHTVDQSFPAAAGIALDLLAYFHAKFSGECWCHD
jgi:hypothetical protein